MKSLSGLGLLAVRLQSHRNGIILTRSGMCLAVFAIIDILGGDSFINFFMNGYQVKVLCEHTISISRRYILDTLWSYDCLLGNGSSTVNLILLVITIETAPN
jgi:hypothetical protein